MTPVLTKRELMRIMERFFADENRGISIKLFAELCGLHYMTIRDVFITHREPLTENVQRRVSRAYQHWKDGQVAIMQNRDKTKFVEYRKTPKPRMTRSLGLKLVNGEIKVNVSIKNRADYSLPTLDESIGRR